MVIAQAQQSNEDVSIRRSAHTTKVITRAINCQLNIA